MKKIVMLCEADSIWIRKYIENVLLGRYQIVLLAHSNKINADFYQENNVTVYVDENCNAFQGIRVLPTLAKLHYLSNKLSDPVDVIQIHFIDVDKSMLFKRIWRKNKQARTVITYWGSDLNRRKEKELMYMKKIFGKIDAFTFMTRGLKERFEKKYGKNYGRKYVVDFGVSAYDTINRETGDTEELKRYWGFPTDKIVVMIGYNAIREQNHMEVIKSLKKISQEMKNKCHIALQFSYGAHDKEYLDKVREVVEESGYTYSIIWDFLDDNKIARLRLATDIMIHAQTTDALSASILEILYSGGILINGEWLEYQELDDSNIDYIKFHDFEDLREKFIDAIQHFEDLKRNKIKNRKKLYDMGSWQAVKSKWIDVLENGDGISYE